MQQPVIEHRGCQSARVIQVIETTALRGDGTPDNPVREIVEFWSLDGAKLSEIDHHNT